MTKIDGKLSLIFPAYNEGENVFRNANAAITQILPLAEKIELIIVNDGSTDDTYEEAQRAALLDDKIVVLSYVQNQGKGYALKYGAYYATGDYIAFCDSDLELPPKQLKNFIEIMQAQGADAVIASKLHKDSKVDYPFIRRIYSYGYYLFLLLLFNLNIRDTQTGLKLFKAECLKPVMEKILVKRFAFDIEVLALLNHYGKKIVDAPIELNFSRIATGRIKLCDIQKMVQDTLAVYYRLNILHYYDKLQPK